VPRKTKINRNPDHSAGESTESAATPESKVAKAAARRPSGGPKKSKPGEKKSTAARKATPATHRSSVRSAEPTQEQIRMRAYFISERRHRLALPGDASSDWLEAKRQLLSEAGRR
jgi:DUF2934 family protein